MHCTTPVSAPIIPPRRWTLARSRRRSRKQNVSTSNWEAYAPSLAHKDSLRNGVCTPRSGAAPGCCIAGYTPYAECQASIMPAAASVRPRRDSTVPVLPTRSSAHYGYDRPRDCRSFHGDEVDRVPHNPYATLRLPRKAAAKSGNTSPKTSARP